MTLLPVVDRELRVASRHGWTYWGRALVAAGAMAVIGWLLLTMRHYGNSAALAKTLFATLSALSFGFTLLAGVLFSADCFARERREGTLGLLFLTDLRAIDITLGKLAATSLGSVYCLMAVLPVLAIPLILGGVSLQEYMRMVAVLLSTLWLALNTGLLASTLAQDARNAAGWAALLMLAVCVGVPSFGAVAAVLIGLRGADAAAVEAWTDWASPFTAFATSFEAGKIGDSLRFYKALIFLFVAGTLALGAATFRLPRVWQEAAHGRRVGAKASSNPSAHSALLASGPQLVAHGPIVWLSNRSRERRLFPWLLLAALAGVWLVLLGVTGREWNEMPGWIATSLVVHFCLKMWLANEAPRVFHDERRTGGMELLLTTELSAEEFVHGRLRALRQLCVGPLTVVSAVDLVMLSASLAEVGHTDTEGLLTLAFWLGRMAMLWLDAAALAWTGTWIGVATRGQRTTGPTWARVVLLPYLLWIAGVTVAVLGNMLGMEIFRNLMNAVEYAGLMVTLILGLNFAVSGGWWLWAATHLKKEFRASFARPLGANVSA